MTKRIITSLLVLVSVILLVAFSSLTNKDIDIEKSNVKWKASKVTGSTHEGTIKLKSGKFTFENNQITGGNFVADMNSINVTDLKKGKKNKLEKHLKSDDFFGVKMYPEASFIITKVDNINGNVYTVTGDITIKGITKSTSLNLTISETEAKGELVIDRSKFNVRYGSGSFFDNLGNRAISDEFTIDLNLVF